MPIFIYNSLKRKKEEAVARWIEDTRKKASVRIYKRVLDKIEIEKTD